MLENTPPPLAGALAEHKRIVPITSCLAKYDTSPRRALPIATSSFHAAFTFASKNALCLALYAAPHKIHHMIVSEFHLCPADQHRLEQWHSGRTGVHYRGFLPTHQSTGHGTLVRVQGVIIPRPFHFHSHLEVKVFLVGEWMSRVGDQLEQFPLLPAEKTFGIAKRLGVPHHGYRNKAGFSVATTDIVWIVREPKTRIPVSVKPSSELADTRVQEKLEIERVYWAELGFILVIITEKEIPEIMVKNIEHLRCYYSLKERLVITLRNICRIEDTLLPDVQTRKLPLNELAFQCDEKLGFKNPTSLTVVKHLLAHQRWLMDMNVLLDPEAPLPFIGQNQSIKVGK